MRSLWDPTFSDEVNGRLLHLTPDEAPLWGALTPHKMICHLGDSLRMALGEVTGPPVRSLLRYPPFKGLALYVLPMPKGVKGPAEYFTTSPTEWSTDLTQLSELLERCIRRGKNEHWGENPFFGVLSKRQWGALAYKHFDYHLRQFGC